MSTLVISGSVVDTPDGAIARVFDDRVRCSPDPEMRLVALLADSPVAVQLDGLTAVNVIRIEADNPVTALLTSAAGAAQAIAGVSLTIISRAVPYTAISLVRVAGQATTVRLILGQGA